MWVFDGEEWSREGGPEETRVKKIQGPEEMLPMVPQLQILEIVPTTPKVREVHVPTTAPITSRKPR
jgi:hypothetical protein